MSKFETRSVRGIRGDADVGTAVQSDRERDEALESLAEEYFSEVLLTSLNTLLAPIASQPLAGESLAGSALYQAIRNAREADDPSLPLGPWERELKRADWDVVTKLCIQGLTTRSKDLQLATWLLESEIARNGFYALAPCTYLIAQLSEHYWEQVFPLDPEYRDNLFRWINEKLLVPLRLIPFTATGAGSEFGWADWEQAQHNEQIRAALGNKGETQIEGTTLTQFTGALVSSPSPALAQHQQDLESAMSALALLEQVLRAHLGRESPSLGILHALIENIAFMLSSELRKRGFVVEEVKVAEIEEKGGSVVASSPSGAPSRSPDAPILTDGDRHAVYASLGEIATTLARLEPHSPVPYLIRRAVEWGQLNTAQLYEEVFVRCEGHISIFELLGLNSPAATDQGRMNAI